MLAHLLAWRDTTERLRRNATQTRGDLQADRLTRFRALIMHAGQHSSYYAAILRERHLDPGTCVPTDFPVLTKRLVRDHLDAIATDPRITRAALDAFLRDNPAPEARYLDEYVVLHSSGTSGEVGTMVYAGVDWVRATAGLARATSAEEPRFAFHGACGGHFAGVSFALAAQLHPSPPELLILDVQRPLHDVVNSLNVFQPDILSAYPSGATTLAGEAVAGRLHIRPRAIHCSGETLTTAQHATIEAAFGCPCLNLYAATETGLLGASRSGDPGMTLFDDDVIIEPAGDHLLVTPLHSRALPLIRYRLDDEVRWTDHRSPYGPYPVVEPLVGRSECAPRFRGLDGALHAISPHVINEIHVPRLARFQFRQVDERSFQFAVCLDRDATGATVLAIEARLHAILSAQALDHVRCTVTVVADLPVDPTSGKFRLITLAQPLP